MVRLQLAVTARTGCKKKAADPFPPSGAVAGWEKIERHARFAAKDLWQYIDGDAEQYIAGRRGFHFDVRLQISEPVGGSGRCLHYGRFRGRAQNSGVGQSSGAKNVQVGDAGIAYEQSVTFRKGPYLVRIVAYEMPARHAAGADGAGAWRGGKAVATRVPPFAKQRKGWGNTGTVEESDAALSDEIPVCARQAHFARAAHSRYRLRQRLAHADQALVSRLPLRGRGHSAVQAERCGHGRDGRVLSSLARMARATTRFPMRATTS